LGFVAGEARSQGAEGEDLDAALEQLLKGDGAEGDENSSD
jgi:hypothetical protein